MSSLPRVTNSTDDSFTVVEDVRLQRMLEMSRDADLPPVVETPLPVLSQSVLAHEPLKPKSRWQRLLKLPRRTWLLIGGVVLLVILALMAGLIIGSFNRPAPLAWQSSPTYEKMYLTMVADKYAKTGDALQVQRDLAGASPAQVAQVLEAMQRETTDSTRRQRLVALTDAVRPPVTQTSYMPLLLNQPAFLLSLFLSLTPMFVAFGLVIGPYLRERIQAIKTGEHRDTATANAPLQSAETPLDASASPFDPNAPMAGAAVTIEPTPEGAAAVAAAEEEEKQKEEEKKKEEEEEEEQQQDDDGSGGLGDLASLFEEEDTSLASLENFCKGLPDVAIDVLLSNAKNAVQALKDAVAHRS